MYFVLDSEEESYFLVSSMGYFWGEIVLFNCQGRGVGSIQGVSYIRLVQFQVFSEVYLGVSQGFVIRCSLLVGDYDFVLFSVIYGDFILCGFYVVFIFGKFLLGYSVKVIFEFRDFVILFQLVFLVSFVLVFQVLVFDFLFIFGQQFYFFFVGVIGFVFQFLGGQYVSYLGVFLVLMNLFLGNNYVVFSLVQFIDL